MYRINKLKPDRNYYPILTPFALLLVAGLIGVIFGIEAAMIFISFFFWGCAAYTFLIFIRTRNTAFIIPTLYQICTGFVTMSLPATIHNPANKGLTIFFILCQLFFFVWLILVSVNRKLKWRGRDILELAASAVEEIGDGYTARPLAAGKTEFSPKQILEFAEFARKCLISVPYVGKDRVVFVPVMTGREFGFIIGLKSDYSDETWVAFDFEGNVSVNISHRDYLEYKESLAFDKLCEALGNLFVEFIESFQRGEGVRVIDRLDALGISIFS
ncbi:hypothetical protein ACFLZW_01590 [Chloroflexota bacterium]